MFVMFEETSAYLIVKNVENCVLNLCDEYCTNLEQKKKKIINIIIFIMYFFIVIKILITKIISFGRRMLLRTRKLFFIKQC